MKSSWLPAVRDAWVSGDEVDFRQVRPRSLSSLRLLAQDRTLTPYLCNSSSSTMPCRHSRASSPA